MSLADDALARCRWNEDGTIATVEVESALFGRTVPVRLFTSIRDTVPFVINDMMRAAVADFLSLDASQTTTLAALLFEDYRDAFASISWGVDVLEGETETEANHREFGIHTPADALQKSELRCVHVDGEAFANRYFSIVFETPWGDLQHVVGKNGRLIAVREDGVDFGQFET